jgi:hypothetical protein
MIDGIHVELPAPIEDLKRIGSELLPQLRQLGLLSAVPRLGLLRKQLGLKIPPNASVGAAARGSRQ